MDCATFLGVVLHVSGSQPPLQGAVFLSSSCYIARRSGLLEPSSGPLSARLSRRRSPAKQHLHSPPGDGMPPPGRRPPYPAEPRYVSRHGRMLLSLASSQPREAISTPFLAPDPVVDDKETAGIILPLYRG